MSRWPCLARNYEVLQPPYYMILPLKTNLLWVYTKHYRQVLVDRHHAPDGVLSQEFLGAFQRQKVAQRPVRVGGFDQVAYAVNPLLVINVEDFTAHIAEEKNSNNLSFIDEQIMKCIL